MKLQHLTLNKLVDATYCCGIARTPIAVLLAAPPGTGKTWSTRGISNQSAIPFIQYISGTMTPTSHREEILSLADQTKLIIHDDIGLCSRFDQDQIFATYMMIISGEIEYRQYKKLDYQKIQTSILICSTLSYYAEHERTMKNNGLFDRLLPIAVSLSNTTRSDYQKSINIFDDRPPKREPQVTEQRAPQTDLLIDNDVSPRWMRSLSKISQFLSEDELLELLGILTRPMKYEV